MREEAAEMLIAIQLGINEGKVVAGEDRTAADAAPTRLDAFLDEELAPAGA